MKLIFSVLIALLLSTAAINFLFAAPINNYPVELFQPDGSKINCFLSGDEYFNYFHTKEGYFIKQGMDGFYYFADQPGNEIITTKYKVGVDEPDLLNIKKWLKPDKNDIIEQINLKSIEKSKSNKKDELILASKTGKLSNIVIFIKFAKDTEYEDEIRYYDSLYNDKSNISFRHFYQKASYNSLDVMTYFYPTDGETVISFTDKNARDYYCPYNETSNPIGYKDGQKYQRERQLLTSALTNALQFIPDNIDFDGDNDGNVDNVTFIVKGGPTGWSSLLWPHRSWYNGDVTINGSEVHDYNFGVSDLVRDGNYGLGTICHEFFHTLGSPDLYHYSYDGFVPVGIWDLMGNTSNPPQLMSNFLKWQYTGWIASIPEIKSEGKYELLPITSQTGSIYKIQSKNSASEYFILEYRKKDDIYNKTLPGSGLLIYRIDSELFNQGNGSGAPDEIYLFRPNGTNTTGGNLSIANFSRESGRTSIGNYTNPRLFLSNDLLGGLEIYNISDCGETISFEISYKPRTNIISPENMSIDQSLKPLFKWRKISQAASYKFELSDDINFNNIIVLKENIKDTVLQIQTELKKGTLYFARVKWLGSSSESAWSDISEFATIPDKTILLQPLNSSNEISVMPEFRWRQNINTNYYNLQISGTSDFSKIIYNKPFIKDTTFKLSFALELNTRYYWKIKSVSNGQFVIDSDIFTFDTKLKEIIITNITRSRDVCGGDSLALKISAVGSNDGYQWYFNNSPIADANDSLLIIPSFTESDAGTYYCNVTSLDLDISLESPPIVLALIKLNNFDDIPQYIKARTDSNTVLTVQIAHNMQEFSKSFALQWFKNDSILSEGKKYQGTKSLKLTILSSDSTDDDSNYRLRLISLCGDTLFSFPFDVKVSVEDFSQNSEIFIIYPNPAHDRFSIEFMVEPVNPGSMKVEIYDYLGRSAGELNPEIVYDSSTGKGTMRCDAGNLPKGMYIIVLSNGKYNKSMTLFLN